MEPPPPAPTYRHNHQHTLVVETVWESTYQTLHVRGHVVRRPLAAGVPLEGVEHHPRVVVPVAFAPPGAEEIAADRKRLQRREGGEDLYVGVREGRGSVGKGSVVLLRDQGTTGPRGRRSEQGTRGACGRRRRRQ